MNSDYLKLHDKILNVLNNKQIEDITILLSKQSDFPSFNIGIYLLREISNIGWLDGIKFLEKQGINIHGENQHSFIVSARYGYLDCVKYFIENGANVHVEKNRALNSSLKYKHYHTTTYILNQCQESSINTIILTKVYPDDLQAIQILLEYKSKFSKDILNENEIITFIRTGISFDNDNVIKYIVLNTDYHFNELLKDKSISDKIKSLLLNTIEKRKLNISLKIDLVGKTDNINNKKLKI